jgi:hypothetical protein
MMTQQRSIFRITALASAFLPFSLIAWAAQVSGISTRQPQPPPSVSEDSGAWRRDPFIGAVKKGEGTSSTKGLPVKGLTGYSKQQKEQAEDIHLQGIMQTDRAFHALINGRTVKTGDAISGVTVKEISRHRVVVLNENKEIIIFDIYQGRIDRGKQ